MTESRPRQSATFRSPAYPSSHTEGAGNSKKLEKNVLSHSYLFVISPPTTLPLSIFLAFYTSPSAFVLWLALLRWLQQLFLSFSCQNSFFFPNITKLVGISCLCVPPCGNILQKIKILVLSTEKVEQEERMGVLCVFFWTDYLCQKESAVYKKGKELESVTQLSSRHGLYNYFFIIEADCVCVSIDSFVFNFLSNFSKLCRKRRLHSTDVNVWQRTMKWSTHNVFSRSCDCFIVTPPQWKAAHPAARRHTRRQTQTPLIYLAHWQHTFSSPPALLPSLSSIRIITPCSLTR